MSGLFCLDRKLILDVCWIRASICMLVHINVLLPTFPSVVLVLVLSGCRVQHGPIFACMGDLVYSDTNSIDRSDGL